MPTLQWLDDEQARRAVEKVPYRMLQPDDTLSCGECDAGDMLIQGDKRIAGGNVLNSAIYVGLPPFDGPKVIYGEWCPWSEKRLKEEQVIFKQTPYDIRVR